MQCHFYGYCSNFQYFITCLELYRTQIVCMWQHHFSQCVNAIIILRLIYTLYSAEIKPGFVIAILIFCLSSDWTL